MGASNGLLDEIAKPISPFVPNLDEPIPVDNENEPYLPYYEHLLQKHNSELPQVISNSYGDDEQVSIIPFVALISLMHY